MNSLLFLMNFATVFLCQSVSLYFLSERCFLPRFHIILWVLYFTICTALGFFICTPNADIRLITFMTSSFVLAAVLFLWSSADPMPIRLFLLSNYFIMFFFIVFFSGWISYRYFANHFAAMSAFKIAAHTIFLFWWFTRGKKNIHSITEGLPEHCRLLTFASAMLLICVVVLVEFIVDWESSRWFAAMICLYIILVVMYAVLTRTISLMSRERYLALLKKENTILKTELETEKTYVDLAKQYRHDIKHHGRYVLDLAQKGDLEGIISYIKSYAVEIANTQMENFCQNTIANAILSNFAARFRAEQISYVMQCSIPEEIPILPVDMCAVMGNLMENAHEACRKCEKPFFELKAAVRDGSLYIQSRNSVQEQLHFQDGFPITTKKNGGTGTKSIASILSKYGGMTDFRQKGNEFVVQIIVPISNIHRE